MGGRLYGRDPRPDCPTGTGSGGRALPCDNPTLERSFLGQNASLGARLVRLCELFTVIINLSWTDISRLVFTICRATTRKGFVFQTGPAIYAISVGCRLIAA